MIRFFLLLFSLFVFIPAHSLLRIDRGIYVLEGYISIRNKNEVYFVINKDTNGQTDFNLSGAKIETLLARDRSKVKMKIKVRKPLMSLKGEAQYLGVVHFIKEAEPVRLYHLKKDLHKESF
jgi:hypothetical protein